MSSARRDVSRWTVAAGVLTTALAVAALTVWFLAARDRHVVTHRSVDAAPTVVSVSDCPVGSLCRLDSPVRPAVLSLIRAQFGAASIQHHSAVVDVTSGRPWAELVQVRTAGGVQVEVTTRCVLGGAAVRSSRPASIPATGPADLVAVTAGAPGCSVAVAVQAGRGQPVPWTQVLAVAQSPAVQLPG